MQNPSFDTWTSLFLFAAMQGLFLSFILYFHKKGNQKATRILATLILLFSIMLAYYVAYWTGYAMQYKWMNGWVEGFTFLYGPLLFFYISVLEKNKMPANATFEQRVKWHLAHKINCSCRPIPAKLAEEMKKRGIKY